MRKRPTEIPAAVKKKIRTPVGAPTLFGSLPKNRRKGESKGISTVRLNAMIGISSTPFLRGETAPLSPDKGLAMQYVEIGVWRAGLSGFDAPMKISVWKDDKEKIGEQSYELIPGENLEINS